MELHRKWGGTITGKDTVYALHLNRDCIIIAADACTAVVSEVVAGAHNNCWLARGLGALQSLHCSCSVDVADSQLQRSLRIGECSVQLAESLEHEGLLLFVGVRELLNDLRGVVGSALQRHRGDTGSRHGRALLPHFAGARVLVSDGQVEDFTESLAALGGAFLGAEAVGQVIGVALRGGIVLVRQVGRILREAFASGLRALLLDDESRVLLGELPQNVAGNLHSKRD